MITLGENGYVTTETLTAWCALRNKDISSYDESDLVASIVISSVDFIDTNYQFFGKKTDESQPMLLPTDVVSIEDIENAASQAAYLQLTGALFVTPSTSSNGDVIMEMSKLGDLEREIEYDPVTASSYVNNKTIIDRMLKPFVSVGAGGLGVCRGAV